MLGIANVCSECVCLHNQFCKRIQIQKICNETWKCINICTSVRGVEKRHFRCTQAFVILKCNLHCNLIPLETPWNSKNVFRAQCWDEFKYRYIIKMIYTEKIPVRTESFLIVTLPVFSLKLLIFLVLKWHVICLVFYRSGRKHHE